MHPSLPNSSERPHTEHYERNLLDPKPLHIQLSVKILPSEFRKKLKLDIIIVSKIKKYKQSWNGPVLKREGISNM
jgi:hypothetical protein